MVALGLVMLLNGAIAFGLFLTGFGAVLYKMAKPTTALILKTSSGDVQAFESKNAQVVADTKAAIERAFVIRR
ncbi:hypothetical protein MESS2_740074 [Mesorhizobium metallidurans STM 2683]|uniref:Uncharacterized protein n=2 Tax=Mesorhizobium metallidurans TaxID=489722 RepID=M5EW31_9HYPH|nr:hypothetical protein MESS2_740074 [Mesorhizobium metallidurans STM 2683]